MEEPLIDILMPTYKPHAEHLRAALESACAQTETRWLLHIFDEPTEVDTRSIVEPFLKDARISYERNERRLGIGGNWNRCVERTHAPYVQFLFQDDMWENTFLENALAIMEKYPTVGVVGMGHRYLNENTAGFEMLDLWQQERYQQIGDHRKTLAGLYERKKFLWDWFTCGMTNIVGEPDFVMMRRSVMMQAGPFNEKFQQLLDVEYVLRMLLIADIYMLPGNHGTFRLHKNSTTTYNRENRIGVLERFWLLKKVQKLLPQAQRKAAQRFIRNERRLLARRFLRQFGNTQNEIPDAKNLVILLLSHPLLFLKATWNFFWMNLRKNS